MQPLRGRCVRLLAFMLTDINFTSVTSLVAAVMQPRRQKIATFIYPNCIRPRRNFAKMFATGKLEWLGYAICWKKYNDITIKLFIHDYFIQPHGYFTTLYDRRQSNTHYNAIYTNYLHHQSQPLFACPWYCRPLGTIANAAFMVPVRRPGSTNRHHSVNST